MNQNYEEFLFSNMFKDLLKKIYPNSQIIDVKETIKQNFGLSNVIFKLLIEEHESSQIKIENLIIKFFLGPNASTRCVKESVVLDFFAKRGFLVPKPFLHYSTNGFNFLVMEYISPQSLDKVLKDLDVNKADKFFNEMLSFLFVLHKISVLELSSELNRFSIILESIDQRKSYIRNLEDLIKKSGFDEFNNLLNWLVEHKPANINQDLSLVHNDFHPFNMLTKNSENIYYIDWEGLSVGNPVIDSAWFIFVASGLYGKKVENILLDKYNKLASKELSKSTLEYYMVLSSSWRMVIFTVILNEIQDVRDNDPTFKERILTNYRQIIKYFCIRIKEITGFSFPTLENKIF